MNREGGRIKGSLVGLGKEDENCRWIIKTPDSSCVHRKTLKNYIVLQKKFQHLYCKYLHRD